MSVQAPPASSSGAGSMNSAPPAASGSKDGPQPQEGSADGDSLRESRLTRCVVARAFLPPKPLPLPCLPSHAPAVRLRLPHGMPHARNRAGWSCCQRTREGPGQTKARGGEWWKCWRDRTQLPEAALCCSRSPSRSPSRLHASPPSPAASAGITRPLQFVACTSRGVQAVQRAPGCSAH